MRDGRTGRVLASLSLAGAAAAALASLPWPIAPRPAAVSDGFEIAAAEIEASAVQVQRLERRLRERWTAVAEAADALASRPRTTNGHPVRGGEGPRDSAEIPDAPGSATAERRAVQRHGAERANEPADGKGLR